MFNSLLLLLLVPLTSASFNDSLARNFMFPLSSAAYSNHPQKCLNNQLNVAQVSKQVTLNCDYFKYDMCSGYTFFDESKKVIGLSFRGTGDTIQLIIEIQNILFEEKLLPGWRKDIQVWNGGLSDDFDALRKKYPDFIIWVTGHSLGGALASLAAAHIAANGLVEKEKLVLYTFGQPRTGDQQYADIHDNLVTSFRVTHAQDMVAHEPPLFMKYQHHTSEVWYNNDMSPGSPFIVCSEEQEDKQCSDQNPFNGSSDDHDSYFGINVSDWGLAGMARWLFLALVPLIQAAGPGNPDFDEDLARNVMMPLASASYTKDPQPCLDYKMPGAKVSMRVEIPCDDIAEDTCSAFTMVDVTRGRIALVFRGTSTNEQLLDEIQTTLFENKTDFRDGGMTSPYFALAFDDLWYNSGIGADFNYLANKYPTYKLLITGHSLGGTFASLATVHILQNRLFPAAQTTFYSLGEPRTGDPEFAALLDSLTTSYRIVHDKDIIPHVPPMHVLGYEHHKYEVFYQNDMTVGSKYTICKDAEGPCSEKNGKNLVFKPDHLMYYNENLLHFGKNACMFSDPPTDEPPAEE